MHTTLEAFLREAIEEILRRKRSDMMRKMGERDPYLPVPLVWFWKPCGLGPSQRWTARSGDGALVACLGWRCSELGTAVPPTTTVLGPDFNRTSLATVLKRNVCYGEFAVRPDYCRLTNAPECRESPPPPCPRPHIPRPSPLHILT